MIKHMRINYLIILLFCSMLYLPSNAQQVNPEAIAQEFEAKGVDEEEVKRRLIAEGFNPDNVDINNPDELLAIQAASDRIVAEIQAENLAENSSTELDTVPPEIRPEIIPVIENEIIDELPEDIVETLPKARIYGQHLYREGAIKFYEKSTYIKPGPNYILGPGDKITVAIWGRSEETLNQEIDPSGFVKFSRIPRIYLGGLSLTDAKEIVKSRLQNHYLFDDNSFEITVTATRDINVSISGDVYRPGTYNISALNSAVNALAAAGGPTDIGSVRNIQLLKANGTVLTVDLYEFLNNPRVGSNYQLDDNDFIIVPVAKKVIGIIGAVNRPFKYELLPNENLGNLVDFAGGLKEYALRKNIAISRFENDGKIIINEDLTEGGNGSSLELKNGDIVEISNIESVVNNNILVQGGVENAGEFAWISNMRLSDLAGKMILKEDAILDIAYLLKLNDDRTTVSYRIVNIQAAIENPRSAENILLGPGDRLIIRTKSEFAVKNSFEIKGAVRKEGTYDLDSDSELKISDAVFLSGGLNENATNFAYIIRKPPGQLSPEYIALDIKNAIDNPASDDNVNLAPNDVIQVYDQFSYYDEAFVSIKGSVRTPREFQYDPSLTLKDVILQAGGLTLEAARNRVDIFRLEFQNKNKTRTLVANISLDENLDAVDGNDFELRPFDQIIVRSAPEFELQRQVFIRGEVTYPGPFYLVDDNSTIVDVIKQAGGLTAEAFPGGATLFRRKDEVGYIIIDLVEAISKPNTTLNVILQEGDDIYIPKQNNLVTVLGAINANRVFNSDIANEGKTNFVYEKGKNAKYYINSSGGFHEEADKSEVTVIHPNGEKHKVRKILFFRDYPDVVPGSTIVVGFKKEETDENGEPKEDIDWGRVLSDSIAQATAILSLILLLQNVD